jgi:hypothetical protein
MTPPALVDHAALWITGAGIAGLGLGIGLVVGAFVARMLRRFLRAAASDDDG